MEWGWKHHGSKAQEFSCRETRLLWDTTDRPQRVESQELGARAPEEKTKGTEEPIKDGYFKAGLEKAMRFLEQAMGPKPEDPKEQELRAMLARQIKEGFGQLQQEYGTKVEELGRKDAEAQFRKGLNGKADALVQTFEHRILIEKMKAGSAESPDSEKAKGLKADLVVHYLKEQGYEKNRGLARYIVDTVALPAGLEAEQFDQQMKTYLTPETIQAAVQQLTKAVGETLPTPEEKGQIAEKAPNLEKPNPEKEPSTMSEIKEKLKQNPNDKIDPNEPDLVARLPKPKKLGNAEIKPENINLSKDSQLNRLIALKHEIGEKERKIFIDGKEATEESVGQLPELAILKKLSNMNPEQEGRFRATLKDRLETMAGDQMKTGEAAQKVVQEAEKLGPNEGLTRLLAVFKTFLDAFKNNDFKTLEDALADFTDKKNPAEEIKKSQTAYQEAMRPGNPHAVDQVLAAYLDPRGKEADALFGVTEKTGKKDPSNRYRNEAKPLIGIYLRDSMGLTQIETITQEGGLVSMVANKEGQQVTIEFSKVNGKGLAKIVPQNPTEPGKAEAGTTITGEGNNEVTFGQIQKGIQAVLEAVAKKPAEKPKEAEKQAGKPAAKKGKEA